MWSQTYIGDSAKECGLNLECMVSKATFVATYIHVFTADGEPYQSEPSSKVSTGAAQSHLDLKGPGDFYLWIVPSQDGAYGVRVTAYK